MRSLLSGFSKNKDDKPAKSAKKPRRNVVQILALEPRFMFDAAGMATVSETVNDPPLPDGTTPDDVAAADSKAVAAAAAPPAVEIQTSDPPEICAADPNADQGKKEVVFVESSVADYQILIDGVKAGVEVVVLDASKDGLAAMADWAQTHSGYDALHIVSHGAEGQINLGELKLDATMAISRSADLATLGAALKADGDVLIYGCNVAADRDGQALVDFLASAMGSDVSASNNTTGSFLKGADWNLEYSTGNVITDVIINPDYIHIYNNILAGTTATIHFEGGGIRAIKRY